MNEFLIWIGAGVVILIGGIYVLGRKMSEPEKMLRLLPIGLMSQQQQTIVQHQAWLSSIGLEFQVAFQFGAIHAAVFKQKGQARYFSFLFHGSTTFSVETHFEDQQEFDSSNSGSLGLFPRPGAFAQSFPGLSAEELWKRHLEGETYLMQRFGLKPLNTNRPYVETFFELTRIRMQYVRSQSFWPVRVLYRFFVTRRRMVNRTVMQNYPSIQALGPRL